MPNVRDPDPAASRLDDSDKPLTEDQFYELIGMNRPLPNGELPKELARPRGLYAKIRKQHEYIQTKYRVFDIFTYIFLSVQLLLSAVFIVLGSIRSDYHIAIAVLGAVSAIVAGALSLMKGQGLPNRLRQVRDDLRNVVFEADELYWDVAAGKNVLFSDIKKLREDYLRVLEEARRNRKCGLLLRTFQVVELILLCRRSRLVDECSEQHRAGTQIDVEGEDTEGLGFGGALNRKSIVRSIVVTILVCILGAPGVQCSSRRDSYSSAMKSFRVLEVTISEPTL